MGNPDENESESVEAFTEAEIKAMKGLLSVQKGTFTRIYNKLTPLLATATVPTNKTVYVKQEFGKFEDAYKKMLDSYTKFVMAQGIEDPGDLDHYSDKFEEISEKYFTMVDISVTVDKKITKHTSTSIPTPKLRIPDMKPFDNSIRKYPAFKENFRAHYERFYGDHAAMVLRENLLTGFTKEICESAKTVDEIFDELDLEFGDQGRIIEAVMADINGIPTCKTENLVELIKIRKVLKTAHVDLEHSNLESHLNHFQTVLTITSKLPQTVKRRWAEKIAKERIPVEKRFDELLDFLALEIRTLELLQPGTSSTSGTSGGYDDKKEDKKDFRGFAAQEQLGGERNVKCLLHPNSSNHFLSKCKKLQMMSVDDQVKFLQGIGKELCRTCLRKHEPGHCAIDLTCNKKDCSKKHFSFLHDAYNKIRPKKDGILYFGQKVEISQGQVGQGHVKGQGHISQDKSGQSSQNDTRRVSAAISPAQHVNVKSTTNARVSMLWDQGSNVTLATRRVVDDLNLEILDEEPTNLSIEIVGSAKLESAAPRCRIQLMDDDHQHVETVIAYVVDKIGTLPKVDLTEASAVFALKKCPSYPDGDIDVLLGTDNFHLILYPITEVNGLRLDESTLGRLVYGRHPSFAVKCQTRTANSTVKAKVATPVYKSADARMDEDVKSLFATDVMGISCSPKCGRCACGKCTLDGTGWSLLEKFEYQQIRDSMVLQDNVITASYPYKRDPSDLPDNKGYAMKRLVSLERGLKKDSGLASSFIQQFDDMLDRGKMRIATTEELQSWPGAVNYLPMNYVLKNSSASTPLRIVFDSSAKVKGISVNDIWGRGPNLVRDSLGVLIRFCENSVAMFADVRKMYQTVLTTPREWHLHRVLWRYMEERTPDIFLITCNSFGDGPAGTVAIAAVHFLAEMVKEQFPTASRTLMENVYVDDILDSCRDISSAKQLATDIDETLAIGGFSVKEWIFVDNRTIAAPSSTPVTIGGNHESVLGMKYDTSTDQFFFTIHLNFGKKKRGAKLTPDLARGQIYNPTIVNVLTKRKVLSQVHTIYDPMGKLQPFLTELKFLLGKLYRFRDAEGRELTWDEAIPPEYDQLWRETLNLFFEIESLRFPRCLSPPAYQGNPTLVVFADSSMIAYGACLYLWWNLDDNGHFFSTLIDSKSRMWPIEPDDYLSVCRGELQAAVTGKRLADNFLRSTRFTIQETVFVIDSEVVHAQIAMDSHNFSTFVGHRVAEIRTRFPAELWWLAKSEDNPSADLVSRGTRNLSDLDINSMWQHGPQWLQTDRPEWPIYQTRKSIPIPELRAGADSLSTRVMLSQDVLTEPEIPTSLHNDDSVVAMMIQTLGETEQDVSVFTDFPQTFNFSSGQYDIIASLIDLTRHNDLNRWLGTTYRVLVGLSWKKGDGCFFRHLFVQPVISGPQRQVALQFWTKQAQKLLLPRMKSGQYKTLTPFQDGDGIYRCNKRAIHTNNAYQPILLPNKHPLSRILVIMYHRRGHSGTVATSAKVRADYHILKLRHIAKSVRQKCQLCRLVEKRLMEVPMGSLPRSRLMPTFAFEHCSCDLFGPFPVKLHVKTTRNTGKDPAYTKAVGLLITCMSTRAIHLEVMHGQSTDSFLQAFRRFTCMRGQPKSMYSDRGGQLVCADANLQSMVGEFDIVKVKEYGALNSMTWTYSSPGSPWQNGVSEALIASVKKTLKTVLPEVKLPILELQTVFYEVGQILNERPINLGNQGASGSDFDATDSTYLCPNQLLLGRASSCIPQGPFERVPVSDDQRLLVNQGLVADWWTKWSELYLPTLVKQSKWFQLKRPAKKGDIVYIRDLNPIRGQYNIGEIMDIRKNDQDIPRDVMVRYRTPGGHGQSRKPDRTVWRDVKNLSLIVGADERSELNPNAPDFRPIST